LFDCEPERLLRSQIWRQAAVSSFSVFLLSRAL
jgi:hypothetical protein